MLAKNISNNNSSIRTSKPKNKPNGTKMLHSYRAFLIEVMNDESGKDLEENAKSIENQNIKQKAGGGEDEILEDMLILAGNNKSLAIVQILRP